MAYRSMIYVQPDLAASERIHPVRREGRGDGLRRRFRFDEGEDPKEALVDWVLNTVEFWMEEETGND